MIRRFLEWRRARKARRDAAEYEELRRISDDFGFGPLLRYGEDRWGNGTK